MNFSTVLEYFQIYTVFVLEILPWLAEIFDAGEWRERNDETLSRFTFE
jgi:hypothetical protein